jgi:hypothetical protein
MKPWYKKLNPVWWVGNDDDPPPIGYTEWGWFLRNPFHNFYFYVIGVADQPDRTWWASYSTVTTFPPKGFGYAFTNRVLPYLAYRGPKYEGYIGWRPSGAFGMAFRSSHSRSA